MDYTNLIEVAKKAAGNSYSPYSHFAVGAAVLLDDGKTIMGTNVENSAFGSTICAERSAMVGAISAGYKRSEIKALAIYHDGDEIIRPCGTCIQVMVELLGKDGVVIMASNKDHDVRSVIELIPYAFSKEFLDV